MTFSHFSIGWYPPPTILVETYEDGVADGFSELGGVWTADAGVCVQTDSNFPGSSRSWVAAGDYNAYVVEVEFTPLTEGTTTVIYAHGDTGDDYRVDFMPDGTRLCIPAWGENWESRSFDTQAVVATCGETYRSRVCVSLEGVSVWLDDLLIQEEEWSASVPLGDGNAGIGTRAAAASFDNFVVSLRDRVSHVFAEESTATNLSLSVSLPGMKLVRTVANNGNVYSAIVASGSDMAAISRPDIPVFGNLVLIPNGTAVSTEVIPGAAVVYENVEIIPAQPPSADVDDALEPPFTMDELVYATDADSPGVFVEMEPARMLRGQQCAVVRINPYQYNPVQKTLAVYPDLKVDMQFIGEPAPIPENLYSKSFRDMFKRLALNASAVLKAEDGADPGSASTGPYGWDYLIFTHSKFATPAKKFSDWKKKCGFKPLVTVIPKGWKPSDIAKAIKTAYTTWGTTPRYVLLIGDAEYVPTHYRTYHPANGEYIEGVTGTDLYYVTMDGSNDHHPDIYMGRLSVDTEQEADARVTAIINYEKSPSADASFYNNATLCSYFQDPNQVLLQLPSGKIVTNALTPNGVAKRRFAQTTEDLAIFLSDSKYKVKKTVTRVYHTESYVTPLKWNDGKQKVGSWNFGGGPAGNPGDSIPSYLKKPGFSWNGGAAEVDSAIMNGSFLVVQRDHAGRDHWGHPYYDWSNAMLLPNFSHLPVVWSISCRSGWFDNETDFPVMSAYPTRPDQTGPKEKSLAEAFERPAYSVYGDCGAVGVLAASRISYSGYNDRLLWGMTDAVWQDFLPKYQPNAFGTGLGNIKAAPVRRMGEAMNYAKVYMDSKCVESNRMKKTQFEVYHWFGDPSMEIRTTKPPSVMVIATNHWPWLLNPRDMKVHVGHVDDEGVYSGPFEEATVTITHSNEPSAFWVAETDGEGIATFSGYVARCAATYDVTVTAAGHVSSQVTFNASAGSAGGVVFDADVYSCASVIEITAADSDLAGQGSCEVSVSTSGGDEEAVVLTESPEGSGIFAGSISTAAGALERTLSSGDGALQLLHGDTITTTYSDEDAGQGNPTSIAATATADCEAPVFDGLASATASNGAIYLEWSPASEALQPVLYDVYRSDLPDGDPGELIGTTWGLSFPDYAATPGETWYYTVRARDIAGNRDANSVRLSATRDPDICVTGACRTNGSDFDITWESRHGDFYRISSTTSLIAAAWGQEETIPSCGEQTSWKLTNVTESAKFFKITTVEDYD